MSNFSRLLPRFLAVALLLAAPLPSLGAQAAKTPKKPKAPSDSAKPKTPDVSKLFKSERPLDITFTANFAQLKRERRDGAPYHAATIVYADSTGARTTVPVRVRTRGIWRLNNCDFPPLRLNFANKTSKQTLFDDLDEPKLVSYCKGGNTAERFVLQELQLYRIFRLLTPVSHQTRLLRVTYTDSATGKAELTRYAFLIEDPARLAERVGGKMVETKGAGPDHLDPAQSALVFLFLYMIGNTDFSFATLHNGQVLALPGGDYLPVPYDFDFSGAINAPYAAPAEGLRIRNVRDRQFRGFCAGKAEYPAVVELFKGRKDAIYALYDDEIGQLIDRNTVKATLDYFDAFYRDIATPRDLERKVLADCTNK